MKRLLQISLMALLACAVAWAGMRTSRTVRRDRQQATEQVSQTRRQATANSERLRIRLNELRSIEAQITEIGCEIARLQAHIDSIDSAVASLTDSIDMLQRDVARIKQSAAQSLRQARSQRQAMTGTRLLLSSKSFSQVMKRASYLRQLDRCRVSKARSLSATMARLEDARNRLQGLRLQQEQALASLSLRQEQLVERQGQMEQIVAELRAQGSRLEQELRQRQQRVDNLSDELDRAIAAEQAEAERIAAEQRAAAERAAAEQRAAAERAAAEQRAAAERAAAEQRAAAQASSSAASSSKPASSSQSAPSSKPPQTASKPAQAASQPASKPAQAAAQPASKPAAQPAATTGTPFAQMKGKMPKPVTGKCSVVGQFGRSRHAALSKVEVENPGIDIETDPGASALAVHPGTVSSVFQVDGYHTIVMVRHGDYITVYANLANCSVKKGDSVASGQALGEIFADAADSNRTILHFEVRHGTEKLNPTDWIK